MDISIIWILLIFTFGWLCCLITHSITKNHTSGILYFVKDTKEMLLDLHVEPEKLHDKTTTTFTVRVIKSR